LPATARADGEKVVDMFFRTVDKNSNTGYLFDINVILANNVKRK